MSIYKYHLTVDGVVHYVGLTKDPDTRKRKHKTHKPPHQFCIIETFEEAHSASESERIDIQLYNTFNDPDKWNKDPGGNYAESSGYSRKGIGGRKKGSTPWNKGLTKDDPRVMNNVMKVAEINRKNGLYEDCIKYLPKISGEKHHMKRKDCRQKISAFSKKRKRDSNGKFIPNESL
jgi:hypothetical protein